MILSKNFPADLADAARMLGTKSTCSRSVLQEASEAWFMVGQPQERHVHLQEFLKLVDEHFKAATGWTP